MEHNERILEELQIIQETAVPRPLPPATCEGLLNHIRKLKNKKAPGKDNITATTLKNLPRKPLVKLLNIINSGLRLHYFPRTWKQAIVVPIPKPNKNHSVPQNYRPISLLSNPGKLYERIILSRLQLEIEELEVLPHEQFGFRPRLSPVLQLLRITETISESFLRKDSVTAIFMDVATAFDKVWHEGLLFKMHHLQLNPTLTQIVRSFLSNRSFQVKLQDHLFTTRMITSGVPQGSVLGPTLYNLYTYDPPETAGAIKALFADDTALLAASRNIDQSIRTLQMAIDTTADWFAKWRIKLNKNKSIAIIFTRKREIPGDNIYIEHHRLPWSPTVKYLGLTLDNKLTWTPHILNTKQKANIIIKLLYPLLKSTSLNLRTKTLLYKSLIRSVITYGIPVWGTAAKTNLNHIQIVQNKLLRIITDAPFYVRNDTLHRDRKMPKIQDWITIVARKLIYAAKTHENPLLQEAMNYAAAPGQPGSRRAKHLAL